MQVTQTSAEGLKHEFKVVVPAGQIDEKVQTRLAEVGRSVRIPGFRPGKVPMPLLKKRYGSSVMSEVLEGAVNDGARQALSDHNLRPALQPKINITNFAEGADLEFTVAIEALPEVEVMELGELTIDRPVAPVSDDEVENALKSIAAQHDKSEPLPADHAAESGEIAVIDFVGSIDGVPFDGGKGEGYPLKLGSGGFIPGFEEQLVGAKAGEERLVKVSFPEDYGASNLAGKPAEFAVTVKEVRKVVPAAIDDELAKAVGQEDLEALKTGVRKEIEADHAALSRAHLKRHMLDALAERHAFTVPEGMVELEFQGIWTQIEKDKAAGRLDPDDVGKSDDELKAEYRAIAERRVRLGLVISEIGKRNSITVNQQDLNRAMVNEARRFPGQEHMVVQYFQRNPQAVENLRAPIFEEKVIDFITELAKVSDRTVTLEELRRDPDAAPQQEAAGEATDSDDAGKAKAKAKRKPAAKKKAAAEE